MSKSSKIKRHQTKKRYKVLGILDNLYRPVDAKDDHACHALLSDQALSSVDPAKESIRSVWNLPFDLKAGDTLTETITTELVITRK